MADLYPLIAKDIVRLVPNTLPYCAEHTAEVTPAYAQAKPALDDFAEAASKELRVRYSPHIGRRHNGMLQVSGPVGYFPKGGMFLSIEKYLGNSSVEDINVNSKADLSPQFYVILGYFSLGG